MRKFPVLFLLSASVCFAQRFPPINIAGSDPTGTACSVVNALQQYTNHIYICTSGTWQAVGGGASGSVSGQTVNSIPKASGATALTGPSALSDNGSVVSSTEPVSATRLTSTELGTSTAAVCPNGPGGALSTSGCAASGTISGQATGVVPLAGGAATINAQSHLDDGVTTAATITSSEPIIVGALGAGSVSSATIGGSRYAARWGDGSTNGIATAQGNNQTVIASPGYANTEQPNLFSFSATPFHYQDARGGMQTDFFHNPTTSSFTLAFYPDNGPLQAGNRNYCLYDQATNSIRPYCRISGMQVNTPGYSIGNPGGITTAGWSVPINTLILSQIRQRGIAESLSVQHTKYAAGDNAAQYTYAFGPGGTTAASDEGTLAGGFNAQETQFFQASCVTGCSASSTSIVTNKANDIQGNGLYLVDSTKGATYTGNATSSGTGLAGAKAVVVDVTVPVSTAWATVSGAINTPINTTPPFTTSMSFTVTGINGTFVAGSLICFGGSFHEQAIIDSLVGSTMTAHLRMPHNGGAVMQGGMCGYGYEEPGSTFSGQQYLYDVIGSTTANTLQVVKFSVGTSASFFVSTPQTQALDNQTYSNGTTVYVHFNGSGIHPWLFTGYTYVLSGSSDAALNAPCTNAANFTIHSWTCTIAGLTGIHTTTTAPTATTTAPINLWPIAEVTDVQNETTTPPTVDGTLALEPNVIQFAASDLVIETHLTAATFKAASFGDFPNNPYTTFNAIRINSFGRGVGGGGTSLSTASQVSITNGNADNFYLNAGGSSTPPNTFNVTGPYYNGFLTDHAPSNEQALFYISPTTAQAADQTYNYNVLHLGAKGGSFANLNYTPYNANFLLNYGILTLSGVGIVPIGGFAKVTMSDAIAFANVVSPTPTLTKSTTGGNPGLTDLTQYCYTVSARNSTGQEPKGTETCITTDNSGSNSNSITISWPETAGSTVAYSVCRGSTGAELAWSAANGIAVTSIVDNGSIAPGGTCPGTTGASLGAVDNPVSVNFNSSGATFKTTVKAVASLGAANTVTLPSVTGTLALLASPTFTGTPAAPTPATADNTTTIATTAYVKAQAYATLASPTFTGTPAAPTPATADSSTTVATTAFVKAQGYTVTIASGTATMTTAAIAAGACGTTVTVAATGTLTTDAIAHAYNAAVAANPGVLTLNRWPTANNVNFAYCNPTAGSVTPTAATLNWRVTR